MDEVGLIGLLALGTMGEILGRQKTKRAESIVKEAEEEEEEYVNRLPPPPLCGSDILFGTGSKGFSNIKVVCSRPGTVSNIYLNCYSNAMRRDKRERTSEKNRERQRGS